MGRRRGERPPGDWPSKVNRGRGGAGRAGAGGPRRGGECAAGGGGRGGPGGRGAVTASRAEPRRADRHPAPAPARDPGRWRGRAAPQPMELENIVANTVLLKAREGEAGGRPGVKNAGARAASELGGATPPPHLPGPRASRASPRADRIGVFPAPRPPSPHLPPGTRAQEGAGGRPPPSRRGENEGVNEPVWCSKRKEEGRVGPETQESFSEGLSQVRDEKMPQEGAAYAHVPGAQGPRTAWTGTKLMQGRGLENE